MSPITILKYWNFQPSASKLFAEHCGFSQIVTRLRQLEQVQRTDPTFVHSQNTGQEYARLFWTMYNKYLNLEPEQKANGE